MTGGITLLTLGSNGQMPRSGFWNDNAPSHNIILRAIELNIFFLVLPFLKVKEFFYTCESVDTFLERPVGFYYVWWGLYAKISWMHLSDSLWPLQINYVNKTNFPISICAQTATNYSIHLCYIFLFRFLVGRKWRGPRMAMERFRCRNYVFKLVC